jgi:hypothetical protein
MGAAGKLATIHPLFVLPVAMLFLLYRTQQVAVDLTDQEIIGNDCLTALRPVQAAPDEPGKPDAAALKAAIAAAEGRYGATAATREIVHRGSGRLDVDQPMEPAVVRDAVARQLVAGCWASPNRP